MTSKFGSPLGRQKIRHELKQGASEFNLSQGQSLTDQAVIRDEAKRHRDWINSEEYRNENEAAGGFIVVVVLGLLALGWLWENIDTVALVGLVGASILCVVWLFFRYKARMSRFLRFLVLAGLFKVRSRVYSDAGRMRAGLSFFVKQWQEHTHQAFLYLVEEIVKDIPELGRDWGRSEQHFRKCLGNVSGPKLADPNKGELLGGEKLAVQKQLQLLIGLNFAINRALRKAPRKEVRKKLLRLEMFVVERLMMYGMSRSEIDKHLGLTAIFWKGE